MPFATAKKHVKVNTYSKVLSLLIISGLSFMLLYIILFYYNFQQQKLITKNITAQFDEEISTELDQNAETYMTLIGDITFWNELVNFVETNDYKWFNNSIAYLVDTNKIDYISAYNIKNEFVSKVSSNSINTTDFIPPEIFAELYKKKSIKFNLKIPEGFVRVYGATIHPSEDPFKNKTQPKGYLFLVKLINKKYFNTLEKSTSTKISIYNNDETDDSDFVYVVKDINDFKGNKLGALQFKRASSLNFSGIRNILIIIALYTLIAFSIFFYFANKWAQAPIKLIKNALTGNEQSINSLKKIRGEFRFIGELFEENLQQKTQLQESKDKSEESDNLKSAFLMNLSHEIRTPMNAIVGFTDLLSNNKLSDADKEEYIKIIKSSSHNLIAIIDDLIEMSRIDTNLVSPKFSSINLDIVIKETFDVVAITNDKKEVNIKLQVPEKSVSKNITTDVTKLNQVLINLLSNALKFTDEGFVILNYDFDLIKKRINFEIKDSGIGIEDNFKKSIFKRFSKTNTHNISANEGLGLGLTISQAYIDMLGGEISLKSQVGIGSTFKFWIPLQFETIDINKIETAPKTIALILDESIKILVAEDDNVNFLLIKQMLKSDKIQVVRAIDGQQAIDICKENTNFDMIFMDIRMPNKNGHEAFESIRKFNPKIPIVAQTSYSFPEEIAKIVTTGFDDYISKPLNKDAILGLVNKHTKN